MNDINFTIENGEVTLYLARRGQRIGQVKIKFTSYRIVGYYLILRIRDKEIARINYCTQKNIDKVWKQLTALRDETKQAV